jgi:tetratricopeptide (TPR) repeat protein
LAIAAFHDIVAARAGEASIMRTLLMACVALTVSLIGPAAVADATVERAVVDRIEQPRVCGSAEAADEGATVADMVMVDGFGTGGFAIDTAVPEAQAWFDHGVRLRWAFEHKESVRAFRKARLLDPTCGMCAWGEAWALGPNLNGGGNDDESQASALAAARDARRLARRATPKQRQMIDALIQRYSGVKATRDRRFAQTMDRIARGDPSDVTVAAITADAWMLKADDWWDEDGRAKDPGITRAMGILEQALAAEPDDPGAIHLYIHLTEWSDDPHKAIPYGERLASLAPGASHLVHMPSHTFYRVGRYRDAMMSNVNAVALDRRYVGLARPPGGLPGMPLHGHNIHFGMGGALMAGGAEEGLKLADAFLATFPDIPADNIWRQIVANNAYANYGRFGSPEQLAALQEPPATHPMLRISWRYARGEAAARAGDAAAVRAEAAAIRDIRADPSFAAGPMVERRRDFTELSQRVLEGRAAMIEGNADAAVAAFTRAAEIQGQGPEGGDPPAIWYPTRRSLAAALLLKGDAAGARSRVLELIEDWPGDPYSYFVLAEAEAALGDAGAAAEARRRSGIEWVGGVMDLRLV